MTNTDTLPEQDTRRSEYDSRYYDIEAMIAQIHKINARAARKGLEGGCTYTVETRVEQDDQGQAIQVQVLVPDYTPVKANGWTLVASASWEGGQPIVNTVPGYEGPMVDRSTLDGHCDECGTSRIRSRVIVCEHPEQGRKVVGGQCIKDLLGHNLSVVLLPDLEPVVREYRGGGSGKVSYRTLDIVVAAIAATQTWGWVSAAIADLDGKVRTSTRTIRLVTEGPARLIAEAKRRNWIDRAFIAQVEQAAAIIADPATTAQAQAVLEWAKSLPQDSEFNINLATLAAAEFVDVAAPGRVGVLSYAPTGLARHLETEAEREARAAARKQAKAQVVNKALGAPKDKVTFEATITGVRYIAGNYGTTTLVKFLTTTNQQAAWFASSTWITEDHVGLVVQVQGTVKDTSEFQGSLETRITRCKVTPTGQAQVEDIDPERWISCGGVNGTHDAEVTVTWTQGDHRVVEHFCRKHLPKGV